jgi:hypothetical protein
MKSVDPSKKNSNTSHFEPEDLQKVALICSGNVAGFQDVRRKPGVDCCENAVAVVMRVHHQHLPGVVTPRDCIECGIMNGRELRVFHPKEVWGLWVTYFGRYQLGREEDGRIIWGAWSEPLTVKLRDLEKAVAASYASTEDVKS